MLIYKTYLICISCKRYKLLVIQLRQRLSVTGKQHLIFYLIFRAEFFGPLNTDFLSKSCCQAQIFVKQLILEMNFNFNLFKGYSFIELLSRKTSVFVLRIVKQLQRVTSSATEPKYIHSSTVVKEAEKKEKPDDKERGAFFQ